MPIEITLKDRDGRILAVSTNTEPMSSDFKSMIYEAGVNAIGLANAHKNSAVSFAEIKIYVPEIKKQLPSKKPVKKAKK